VGGCDADADGRDEATGGDEAAGGGAVTAKGSGAELATPTRIADDVRASNAPEVATADSPRLTTGETGNGPPGEGRRGLSASSKNDGVPGAPDFARDEGEPEAAGAGATDTSGLVKSARS
jgi:hypothetical protein